MHNASYSAEKAFDEHPLVISIKANAEIYDSEIEAFVTECDNKNNAEFLFKMALLLLQFEYYSNFDYVIKSYLDELDQGSYLKIVPPFVQALQNESALITPFLEYLRNNIPNLFTTHFGLGVVLTETFFRSDATFAAHGSAKKEWLDSLAKSTIATRSEFICKSLAKMVHKSMTGTAPVRIKQYQLLAQLTLAITKEKPALIDQKTLAFNHAVNAFCLRLDLTTPNAPECKKTYPGTMLKFLVELEKVPSLNPDDLFVKQIIGPLLADFVMHSDPKTRGTTKYLFGDDKEKALQLYGRLVAKITVPESAEHQILTSLYSTKYGDDPSASLRKTKQMAGKPTTTKENVIFVDFYLAHAIHILDRLHTVDFVKEPLKTTGAIRELSEFNKDHFQTALAYMRCIKENTAKDPYRKLTYNPENSALITLFCDFISLLSKFLKTYLDLIQKLLTDIEPKLKKNSIQSRLDLLDQTFTKFHPKEMLDTLSSYLEMQSVLVFFLQQHEVLLLTYDRLQLLQEVSENLFSNTTKLHQCLHNLNGIRSNLELARVTEETSKVERFKKDSEESRKTVREQETKLKTTETEKRASEEKLQKAQSKIDELERQKKKVISESDLLRQEREVLKEENGRLTDSATRIRSLEAQIAAKEAAIRELAAKNAVLVQQVQGANARFEEQFAKERSRSKAEAEQLSTQALLAQKAHEAAQQQLTQQISGLTAELEALKATLETTKAVSQAVEADKERYIRRLRNNLFSARAANRQLEQTLDKTRDDLVQQLRVASTREHVLMHHLAARDATTQVLFGDNYALTWQNAELHHALGQSLQTRGLFAAPSSPVVQPATPSSPVIQSVTPSPESSRSSGSAEKSEGTDEHEDKSSSKHDKKDPDKEDDKKSKLQRRHSWSHQ